MLRLLALFALLLMVSLTVWFLSSSHIFHSPNHTLRSIDSSLNATARSLFASLSNLFAHHEPSLVVSETAQQSPVLFRAEDAANLQDIMASVEALNKQVEKEKDNPSYHNRLGILYAQLGEFSNAIQHLKQAIVLCRQELLANKKQSTALSKTAKEKEKGPIVWSNDESAIYVQLNCAHSNLARIYDKLGDHKRVIAELEDLNKDIVFAGDIPSSNQPAQIKAETNGKVLLPKNKRLTAREASILARAEALRQVGRLNEAVQEYVKLVNLNPNLAIAHQRLGLAAVTDNNFWLAINELQIASQLDKNDPDTENDLGLIYQQIGDYKAAKQSFALAHKISPKHLSAAVNYANILASGGDYRSGMAIMRQATIDHPKSPLAHNNLASLIARSNNQTEAAKEFSKAINLDPNLASAHYGLGIALLKLKSYAAAAKEFQTAMTLSPGILDLQNKIDLANRCNLRTLAYTQHRFD